MNQRTLSRAIAPVLERGKHDGIGGFVHINTAIILAVTFEFTGCVLGAILEKLESQALQLSPPERGELIHRLIVSLDGEPEESPEVVAKAWDEEIARRVDEMEAGRTQWIPAEDVFKEIDAVTSAHSK